MNNDQSRTTNPSGISGPDQAAATTGTHTPGPWGIRPGICRNDHPDTSADVHGPFGDFVANCGCHEQAIANARLIAAAPDLLEACRELRDGLAAAMRAIAICDGADAFIAELKNAGVTNGVGVRGDAAIAKAEGR
jgi:hypothetical protein